MEDTRIVMVFNYRRANKQIDIEVPLDISVNELIIGLDRAFNLEIDTTDLSKCHLKTENPIALLRGNKTLREYGLWNGTIINYL